MTLVLIAVAVVPAFGLLIGLELLLSGRRRAEFYRFDDSLSNLSTGVISQLVNLLGAAWITGVYVLIFDSASLFHLPSDDPLVWVLAIVLFDVAYYSYHRCAHRSAALWASHVVHHQSEHFNVTVALRQGAFQPFFSCAFYWPIAIIGVPPIVFLGAGGAVTLYGVFIHTAAAQFSNLSVR